MSIINYLSDKVLGGGGVVHGSDGRLNTSSRSDARIYYNSRDASEAYSLAYDDAACSAGDYIVSLFNNRSDTQHLVIHAATANSDVAADFKLSIVEGTAAGGAVSATPTHLNRGGFEAKAQAIATTVANSDSSPISGLTEIVEIDHEGCGANGHVEFKVDDSVRLGPGQGIAIEKDGGASGRAFGVIFFYYEDPK